MKALGLTLAVALAATAWQSAGPAEGGPAVMAGIDAGGAPHTDCIRADSDWLSGCEADELRRIVVAAIHGSGAP